MHTELETTDGKTSADDRHIMLLSPQSRGFPAFFAVWNPSSLFSALHSSSGVPGEGTGLPVAVDEAFACSRTRQLEAGRAPLRENKGRGGADGAGLSDRGGVRTCEGGAERVLARRHTPSCVSVAVAAGGCLHRSSARRATSFSLCCCCLIRSRSAARCFLRSSRNV